MVEPKLDYEWGFQVPDAEALEMLKRLAWARGEKNPGGDTPLVWFHYYSGDEPEDSGFIVDGVGGPFKRGLNEAIYDAYKKWQLELKEERRRQYEELKKEFEPEKGNA
jgi:hypothetical protein